MLDYLINLLEDATDFSWASAKASHTLLLCRMEQGEIESWTETEKINRVRRAHAHVVWQIPTVTHKIRRNHTVMFHVFTSIKVCACRSSHIKLGVSSIERSQGLSPHTNLMQKGGIEKRVNWGMPNRAQ